MQNSEIKSSVNGPVNKSQVPGVSNKPLQQSDLGTSLGVNAMGQSQCPQQPVQNMGVIQEESSNDLNTMQKMFATQMHHTMHNGNNVGISQHPNLTQSQVVQEDHNAMQDLFKTQNITEVQYDVNVNVSQCPVNVSQQPINITQYPVNVSQQPVNVSQQPMNVSQQPINVSQQPVNVSQQPVNVSQQPINVSQQPVNVSQQPVNVSQHPMNQSCIPPQNVSQNPKQMHQSSIQTSSMPQNVSQINMSKKPEVLNEVGNVNPTNQSMVKSNVQTVEQQNENVQV